MALNGKMQAYAEARALGLAPLAAAALAGYSGAGIRVTTSRIEARKDLQAEVKRLKSGRKPAKDKPEPEPSVEGTAKWLMKDHYDTPLALLKDLWNNPRAPSSIRYQAAKDALPYCHARKEAGKKDEVKERATKAAKGRFATTAQPSHSRMN